MPTVTISDNVSIAGLSIQSKVERSATGHIGQEIPLPAAKVGSLTTRTDDDTGVVTLAASHGIVSTDVVDVYWADGVRYGMTATVSTNEVSVEGGAGDVLPADETAVTLAKQVAIDTDFLGNLVEAIVVSSTLRANLEFRESAATAVGVKLPAGEGWRWFSDQGITNPLSGKAIASIQASCGNATTAATLKLGVLYNSVSS